MAIWQKEKFLAKRSLLFFFTSKINRDKGMKENNSEISIKNTHFSVQPKNNLTHPSIYDLF